MRTEATLDALDARLLLALDADPDASTLALARTLGVARNTVHARLTRLARTGALREPSRRLDPAALGHPLVAFVSLSIDQASGSSATDALAGLPQVVEAHATTGDADVLVKVLARDTADLYRTTAALLALPGVERSSTTISLAELLPTRLGPLLAQAAEQ